MATIQFKGFDNVVKAFEYKEVDAWSIFDGKRLLHKGIGIDDLKQFLTLIMQSTNAIYTLKVYEDIDDARKIKSNTPDDGSFNFRLNADEQDITFSQYQRTNNYKTVDERLGAIEKLLAEDPEDEDELSFMDSIGKAFEKSIVGAIEEPDKPNFIADALKNIFNIQLPVSKPAIGNVVHASTIAGLETGNENKPVPGDIEKNNDAADRLQRLGNAIDILEKHDKKLVEHLEQLAKIAQYNPQKFESLLTMMNLF